MGDLVLIVVFWYFFSFILVCFAGVFDKVGTFFDFMERRGERVIDKHAKFPKRAEFRANVIYAWWGFVILSFFPWILVFGGPVWLTYNFFRRS